jgi:hypothetical protein
MDNVKILRLNSGEDIIASLEYRPDSINLKEPMLVSIHYDGKKSGVVMSYWLPAHILKQNSIAINSSDVLGTLEPTDSIIELYEFTSKKFNKLLEEMLEDSDDNIDDNEEEDNDEYVQTKVKHKTH